MYELLVVYRTNTAWIILIKTFQSLQTRITGPQIDLQNTYLDWWITSDLMLCVFQLERFTFKEKKHKNGVLPIETQSKIAICKPEEDNAWGYKGTLNLIRKEENAWRYD